MAISEQSARKNLSPAWARGVANLLQVCDFFTGNDASDSIGRCKYGQNIFAELKVTRFAGRQFGHLSVGLPSPSFSENNLRQKLYWCPFNIPPGKSICVASSRLNRKLDTYDRWFDAIRTIATRLNPAEYFFVTAAGTTTDAFLQRAGQLFGFAVLKLKPLPKNVSAEWFQGCLSDIQAVTANNCRQRTCYFGKLEKLETKRALNQRLEPIDQLLIQIASEVRILSVRKNGNIVKATRKRLAQDSPGETKLLIDARLTPNSLKEELLNHGATAWWLYDKASESQSPDEQACHERPVPRANRPAYEAPILEISEIKSDQFLLHWTRRRVGPWPDQTSEEYLDDLIFRSGRRDHGGIFSLARILASRRVLGTNQLTRSSQPVVCFSNMPLEELANREVFRKHLGRWDRQPFGIAIDRERLMEMGAKPVTYGDESTWEKLDSHERVFFQLARTRNSDINWQEENEWRIIGDLDLSLIDARSAVVFVKSLAEAKQVSPISLWPIVILESSP